MRRLGRQLAGDPISRRAFRRFVVAVLLAQVLVLAAAAAVGVHLTREAALTEALSRTQIIADTVVGPLLDERVRAGRPGAVERLEDAVNGRINPDLVAHIRVLEENGTVVWSDDAELIGSQLSLEDGVAELVGTRGALSQVSGMEGGEFYRDLGPMIEVYAGSFDADGVPFVLETYRPVAQIDAEHRKDVLELMALTGGAVVLLALLLLPLSLGLARRVGEHQRERSALVRHALRASELERRRIAQDLHDGVIQDLAGVGYALRTLPPALDTDSPQYRSAHDTLRKAREVLSNSATSLRTMLIDITPPHLDGQGALRAALVDLCRNAEESGVGARLTCRVDSVPHDCAMLVYRVVREGLRNVVKHAPTARATVDVEAFPSVVTVRVEDDGPGRGPSEWQSGGHYGLRLLTDTLVDVGGDLEFRATSRGAVLTAVIPLHPAGS